MLKFKTFPWANETFTDCNVIEGFPRLYETEDGQFPSMTSLLSILDDGGIDEWINRVGKEEADRIKNEASKRGNILHDYNERYLKNELKRQDLSGEAKILFNRVKHILDEVDLVLGTEVVLWNKDDRYAGRTDAIVMMHDHLTIMDHKNSRKPIDTRKQYGRRKLFKYCIQCCGYARALYKMKGYQATKGCLVVGNHLTSTSDKFFFDLESFEKELDILVNAYHGNKETINRSMYYSL